ncbi:hypothetical protein B0I21_102417 [Sphingobacterium paludis]|uniref:Uncharacterized protein n=1 Tax=Sphingobacterium paludis TaxID=1476465 RepID=A0A4R7D7A8_9SPHI|nr:hypothetical protein B0I21_102417 [Sphingobacterium paludis]
MLFGNRSTFIGSSIAVHAIRLCASGDIDTCAQLDCPVKLGWATDRSELTTVLIT